MTAFRKDFDETKYMSFLIKDNELLEKYNEILEKVKNILQKEFDKINPYNRKINTNFHSDKIPKEGPQYMCLSVILLDSIFRTGKTYYPQVFLEECKYVIKENKIPKYIIHDVEILILIEKILMKKLLKKIQMERNSEKENSSGKKKYFFSTYIKKW